MATSSNSNPSEPECEYDYGEDPHPGPYFCHRCQRCISRCTRDFTCPDCASGFIEPIALGGATTDVSGEENMDTEQAEQPTAQDGDGNNISISINHGSNSSPPQGRPMRRGVRRTRIAIHRIPTNNQSDPTEAIQRFFREFMAGLLGEGLDLNSHFQLAMDPIILNGDESLWTRAGLDNILTMFMNEVETAGPPPATKDQIDALPDVVINQSQFDRNLQCNVCMEDFAIGDSAKELPCKHLFHKSCIVTWLELHCTCPICRNRIGPSAQDRFRQQQQQQQQHQQQHIINLDALQGDATTPSSSSQPSPPTSAAARSSSVSSTPQTSSSAPQPLSSLQQPPSLPQAAGFIPLPPHSVLFQVRSAAVGGGHTSSSNDLATNNPNSSRDGSSSGRSSSSNIGGSGNSGGGAASRDGLVLGALRRLQQQLQQQQPQPPQRYLDDMNLD
ncbi:hypothetical protein HELRODRAFT_192978 [Helobdella robusta]|uniref:RING-type E3 ubiquitin transferase n=1 Tax=Helobdella robusta TaxID=6412 RepID=T1FUH2_HELRO|nr:hypothetical protein HELRODRAFT_192978 [Helobdella robusta]ESN98548.1 hypothetical protein HELRODRAFT_192978 [Helobdella robusta]